MTEPLAPLRLGINIDHVATLRNARGGTHPGLLRAAQVAQEAGAQGITMHLREDRRHIRDADLAPVKEQVPLPLNLEMAATEEMARIALALKPHAVCLVPEKRTEVTTEGGLDVAGQQAALAPTVRRLVDAGIRVSLFVDPDAHQLEAAKAVGAPVVELHTGAYAEAFGTPHGGREILRLQAAAEMTVALGLECHAGHGLSFANVGAVARLAPVVELNIGHFLVGEAIFIGLGPAIREMRRAMDAARA